MAGPTRGRPPPSSTTSAVRAELAARDIHVPADTWFVAAEHDTTTDEVHLLEVELAPESHVQALGRLAEDLAGAGRANAATRLGDLPGRSARAASAPARAARARSADWAQTRPEWGLAGNGSFVIGPRDLTRAVDLGGRTFLHSYDAAADVDGTVLETILTAPMVVASWINLGYYGATVDPSDVGRGGQGAAQPRARHRRARGPRRRPATGPAVAVGGRRARRPPRSASAC